MALYKNKWVVSSWATLSASVADVSNSLEFRPVHKLPYELQLGTKSHKNISGSFKRTSVLKIPSDPQFENGVFVYDTSSGVSYTPLPKTEFKLDMTDFLNSSSLSATAKTNLSASFNTKSWPSTMIQMAESSFTPATASFTVPCAFIGDEANGLVTVNNSTNTTYICLQGLAGAQSGSVSTVEFTLPMETISFTGTFASRSLKFSSFSGSDHSPAVYANSAIYTPVSGSQTTASIIGVGFGSGSINNNAYLYPFVDHGMYIKAVGDESGSSVNYSYGDKLDVLQFQSGSVVASSSFTRYAMTDTSKTGSSTTGSFYFVTGSQKTLSHDFWIGFGPNQGSHLFADEALTTAAKPGIYVFSGSISGSGAPSVAGQRVPRFNGSTY